MGRPHSLDDSLVISVRVERDMYQMLSELAALESMNVGRKVSVNELIRNGLNYTYRDNERMRESFKRSRSHITKRFK